MQTRKASLCAALLAAVMLAGPAVMAQDVIPTQCLAVNAGVQVWNSVTVTGGPCTVQCLAAGATAPSPPQCDPSGKCTAIEYTFVASTNLSHVAVLTEGGVNATNPPNAAAAACDGDTPTGLGIWSCHEQAVRANSNSATAVLAVIVNGIRKPIPTSVLAMQGKNIGACKIMGVGGESVSPFATSTKTETKVFEGCGVQFTYDANGNVIAATPNYNPPYKPKCLGGEAPGTCCTFGSTDVGNLQLELTASSAICPNPPCALGAGKFGDGYISSGSNSCTSRVLGGKLYTWGSPCP